MLGERSDQRGLWEADRLYLDHTVLIWFLMEQALRL